MKSSRAAVIALALAGAVSVLGWLLHISGLAYWLWIGALTLVAAFGLVWPKPLISLASAIKLALRGRVWRGRQGQHHAFAGVNLYVCSDARHEWLAAADLQRILGTHEPEDAVAARHSGRWRRDDARCLLLRVDAVVEVLEHSPRRMDPHVIHLRRYLEREVLYPAAQRRRRSTAGAPNP